MKSLFSRLRSANNPPPSRSTSSTSRNQDKESLSVPARSPSKSHSPRQGGFHTTRASSPLAPIHSQSSSSSSDSTHPRSSRDQSDDEPLPDIAIWEEYDVRARTVSSGECGGKKVTFRSPAPTPTTSVVLDVLGPSSEQRVEGDGGVGSKVDEGRTAPASPTKKSSTLHKAIRPTPTSRSSTSQSIAPSRPFFISRQSLPSTSRKVSLPPLSNTSRSKSSFQPNRSSPSKPFFVSPSPSDSSIAATSTRSYLTPPNSWSEMAEEDLIANLGPKERTRQEVLWEIVSSEERYVQELIKLNDTFCSALLPISARSPSLNLFDPNNTLSRTLSPASLASTSESFENLPIAAQYASSVTSPTDDRPTPASFSGSRLDAYHALTNGRPSHKTSYHTLSGKGRSHHSMPPPSRSANHGGVSGLGRMSYQPRIASTSSAGSATGRDVQLPDDLETVLSVLGGGILEGHLKLAAALRRRYDNQYPLVRTLADVFTAHSYILREYATYVLHLERALSQVDEALSAYTAKTSRRESKRLNETAIGRLGKILLSLEEVAAERGESGLVISLSKPFQRLIKYPLLFQNLLYNTDPSLREYEATLAMVDEVEVIVRAIEDEKGSSEERERTRDIWARIEGLEREKMLMTPKPKRLLESEIQILAPEGSVPPESVVKQKKSFKRLSDVLHSGSDHKDFWIVRFSDVSLLCERTGLTHLPISSLKSGTSQSDSLDGMSERKTHNAKSRRAQSVRARNLYRFVRVHEWHLKQKTGSTEGLLAMEDISRARIQASKPPAPPLTEETEGIDSTAPITPRKPVKVPLKGDGGRSPARSTPGRRDTSDTESIGSDHLSVMSFAFKGSNQIKPAPRDRPVKGSLPLKDVTGPPKRGSGGYIAGSGASAKFAHRLRSKEEDDATMRPTSRTRQSLPPAMASKTALMASDTNGRVTPLRPAWNAWNAPIKSTTTSTVRGRSTITPMSPANPRPVRGQATPSPTKDVGATGLSTAFHDIDGVTPMRRTGRRLGGMI